MSTYVVLIVGVLCGLLQAAAVSGIVSDNTLGTKLESVQVQLRSGTKVIATDTTGVDGVYSFANVDAGRYTIRATKAGYTAKSVADTVKAGEISDKVNIALSAIVTATVGGTINDSTTGTALSRVIIQLRSGTSVVKTDTSDTAGRYSFEKVEADTYTVRVSLAGYVAKTITVIVKSSAAVNVTIPMSLAVITTVGGTLRDSASGTVLAGARVQLRYGLTVVRIDTSDTSGKYSFEKVEVDTYSVRATLSGFITKTIAFKLIDNTAVTVDVSLAATVTASVGGTITDSITGAAGFQAVVQLRSGTSIVATDTSGLDGTFSFDKVEKGDYLVRVSSIAFKTKTITVKVSDRIAMVVAIPLARKSFGSVFGKVTADSLSGGVLGGVYLILAGDGVGADTTTTDAQGSFLFNNVETGIGYTVSGSKIGFSTKTITLSSKNYNIDTVSFFLKTLSAKNVIVCVRAAADSTGIARAAVTFVTSGGSTIIARVVDSIGNAVFEKTEEGTYAVSVAAAGFSAKSQQYTIKSGSADSLNIYLVAVPGGTKSLHGTIVDSMSGLPVANVIVSISFKAGDAAPVTLAGITGSEGTYSIIGIPSIISAVTLTVKITGYKISAKNVALGTVTVADTTRFDFTIHPITQIVAAIGILHHPLRPDVTITPDGRLSVFNLRGTGIVRLFRLDGKLLHQFPFGTFGSSKDIIIVGAILPHAALIVRVTGSDGNVIVCKKTMVK